MAVAAAAGSGIAGCGGTRPSVRGPVTVPIALAGRVGGPYGVAPVVRVRIDGGRPLPVLLDTGSTGLRILARDVPTAERTMATAGGTHTWATGAVTTERLITARVTIGTVRTTRAVHVGVVNSVTCPGSACEGWPSRVPGIVGTLGVSLLPDAATENPLLALAGARARSWRITLAGPHPDLELGAPIPSHPVATFGTPRPSAGPTGGPTTAPPAEGRHGRLPDDTSAPEACWQIGSGTRRRCLPTVFDTGTSSLIGMNMSGARSSARLVNPGTRISVWASATAPRPFWSFESGYTQGRNLIGISTTPLALIVSGMPTFQAFAITFDAPLGRQYFTRL